MSQTDRSKGVRKRIVLHFPGFEPLNAEAHRARYRRSAAQAAAVWGLDLSVGPLTDSDAGPVFSVACRADDRHAESRIFILDHHEIVDAFNHRPLPVRLLAGFRSAARVAMDGGLSGYFRHAWRFGLFFVFPFLLVALALALSAVLAFAPVLAGWSLAHLVWSVPLATLAFLRVFVPQSARLHTLHLFSDWELAAGMARLDRPIVNDWLDATIASARAALGETADEYVITSHSMGSNAAAHVIGALVQAEPALFDGKRIVFATLGSALLQCGLLTPATVLRARVGAIARSRDIFWFDVHCLTDAIHFYKCRVATLCGHADAPQPSLLFIRMKHMLSPERYRRIKKNLLRVHRQYVLGPDLKAPFDFTLLTAGPLPAADFAGFSQVAMPDFSVPEHSIGEVV